MRTRLLRGTTEQLNGLDLQAGRIAVDTEKKAVRLYDGQTLGGFEIIGAQALKPGDYLIAGTTTKGFYGEINDFITYENLSLEVGLSSGTLVSGVESTWLKFSYNGQILLIAKKPVRHSISWLDIDAINAVYDDVSAPTVVVDGKTYRVTLLTGSTVDPAPNTTASSGGEWNDLIYPVHVDDPNTDNWDIGYTNTDLQIAGTGDGSYTWAQETRDDDDTRKVVRGWNSVTAWMTTSGSNASTSYGWRPCLRLIS